MSIFAAAADLFRRTVAHASERSEPQPWYLPPPVEGPSLLRGFVSLPDFESAVRLHRQVGGRSFLYTDIDPVLYGVLHSCGLLRRIERSGAGAERGPYVVFTRLARRMIKQDGARVAMFQSGEVDLLLAGLLDFDGFAPVALGTSLSGRMLNAGYLFRSGVDGRLFFTSKGRREIERLGAVRASMDASNRLKQSAVPKAA